MNNFRRTTALTPIPTSAPRIPTITYVEIVVRMAPTPFVLRGATGTSDQPCSAWHTGVARTAAARNQRGVGWKSLRTGKRHNAKEELDLNGTERAKYLGTRSSSGKRGSELQADQSPSPDSRMNG